MAGPPPGPHDTGGPSRFCSVTASDISRSLSSQYTVERELGGGGMSRVFVAFDESLGRRIVVKVLHPQLAANVSIERFRREIRVAAQLVHPHIVPLLSAGETEGLPYYTMPYIEGESLRALLQREKRLSTADASRIVGEIAGALDYAHRQGIIHRDIKPENVLIQDGHAVVTDFGIARALSNSAASGTITQIGVTVGTPAYMSPEQSSGDPDLDARADVYSLGCVLYEMLAGAPPYAGDSTRALMAQHFSAPIPRIRSVRGEVSASLEDVITRALAKEPRERFPSAAQFASGIGRATTAAGETKTEGESIAVLPFANLSSDTENEYLSDGITEEILNALTRLEGVRVAARSSAFSFKGQQRDVREIASTLNVRHVLQGSVRRAGERLRVTAQLVDASSGYQLWSDKYDRDLRDVFAIQDEIAAIIASRLEAQFKATVRVRRTVGLEAYDAYLRGRFYLGLGTPDSWNRSVENFEQAVKLDGEFADAHVGLAEALCYLSFVGASNDVVPRAKATIARALALEPDNADANAVSGFCKCWFDWDFIPAMAEMRRAAELNPGSSTVHYNLAILLANLGDSEGAIHHGKRVVELDPLWSNAHQALQWALMTAGRYAEALARARLALELAPGSINALFPLSWAYVETGDYKGAIEVSRQMLDIAPGGPMGIGTMAVANARAGDRGEALRYIAEMERAPTTSVSCAYLTWAYAAVGQLDKAFEYLDRAVATKDQFTGCMPVFAWWDPLRADPRFLQAMKRAGFPDWCYRRTHEFLGRAKASPRVEVVPSIAVLPFANLSPDAADEYFADGLTDEIITDLSGVKALRVIARASMMRFKGSGKDPATVAREVGVRYALDGSVRRAGSSLRLTARLIDAADGSTLWSDKLGGTVDDVFAMQEQVSRTIVGALKLKLTPQEERRLADRPIADVQAYEAFLQARQAMWTFSVPSLLHGASLLESAIDRIGENALLLGALGHAHIMMVETGDPSAPTHLVEARRCADRARALAPDSFEARWLAGLLHFRHGEIREAIDEFGLARRAQPNNADIACLQSYMYILAGRDDEARQAADDAIAIDPLTPLLQCMPGFCEWSRGRLDAAEPFYRRYMAMDPLNPSARQFLLQLLAHQGRSAEAITLGRAIATELPGTVYGQMSKVFTLALEGRTDEARRAVTDEMRSSAKHSEVFARIIGELLVLCGDTDGALDCLEQCVQLGMSNYPFLATHNRLLQPLRGQPRFERLLERVRSSWESFRT